MNHSENQLFFIIGCQRTGTTLMKLILESHSKIECFDEPLCYDTLRFPEKIKLRQEVPFLGFKTPVITEQMNELFFADPSLDFIIPNLFQNCPRIFMIRDVRDTISSMMNLKQNQSSWYEIWPRKNIDFWTKTIPNFESKFEDDLKKISDSEEKLVSTASLYWKYKTTSYFEQNNSSTCKIFYEELVKKPEDNINKVIKFLDLDWDNDLLNHHTRSHPFTDSDGITVGEINTKKPINDDSVGNFNDILSPSQLDAILDISGVTMKKLGYKI